MNKHYIVAPGKNLDVCLKQRLYGHRKNMLKHWQIGDRVIYYVEGAFAAVGTVTASPYFDERTQVWPDDIYPHRVQVTPDSVLAPEKRIRLEGDVKKAVVGNLGKHWIFWIRDVHPVPTALFDYLCALIDKEPNKYAPSMVHESVPAEIKDLQKEAKNQVEKKKAKPPAKEAKSTAAQANLDVGGTLAEAQSHDRTQWYLIKLGRALGCDTWVAKNDRGKSYKGEAFADLCLNKLPSLGFDQDTSRIIENIDVIWLKGSVIQCAFEVEHTTYVYSGLLRLADLVQSQPHITIKLFIVAPKERKSKVVYELNRPVFRELLCDHCKYIPYDKLETTLAKIEDFQGYLQVGLVEKIAEPCNLKAKLFE